MTTSSSHPPISESEINIPETRRQKLLYWSSASLIALVYAFYYGKEITLYSALPYFDQTNYIYRIYYIFDAWKHSQHLLSYFNPLLILGGSYSNRPPLMMIPAALIWGDHAHPQSVALLWLVIRMGALMLAMVLIARLFRTARFIPAALLLILGNAFFLDVNPHQYQMDHTFAFFSLLVFTLSLWDLQQPSLPTASATAIGAIMLLLIKPAALSFLFPILCIIAVRCIVQFAAVFRKPEGRRRWILWTGVYVVMLTIFILLWKSPYGDAVADQYKLGNRGYWAWQVPLSTALQFATLIVPAWILLLLAYSFTFRLSARMSRWTLACGVATLLWWYTFNIFLTYTVDERILASGLAVGVTFALLLVRQDKRILTIATTIAAVLFVTNISNAADIRGYFQPLLGPTTKTQHAVREVGLLALAERVRVDVGKISPPTEQVIVITAVNDEYVEYSSLNLAMRYINGDEWSEIQFQSVPWGSTDFDLDHLLQSRWFLTKRQRSVVALQGDIWTSMQAMDQLITSPESPLRSLFERRLDSPIVQPESGYQGLLQPETPDRMLHETVTLWRLTREPTRSELALSLRWIEPNFRNTPGHDALLAEITRTEAAASQGTSLKMIDAATANRIAMATDKAYRNVRFNDNYSLLGIVQHRTTDGIDLELAWQSLKDQALDCVNFVHLLNGQKEIVGQYDYKLDELEGQVRKGDVWQKIIHIPQDKLTKVNTIGLGMTRPPSEIFHVDHGPTDWDDHRLTIPLK